MQWPALGGGSPGFWGGFKYETYLCQPSESTTTTPPQCKIVFPFVCDPDLICVHRQNCLFFHSRGCWGSRESLQEVRKSPRHHLTALYLPGPPNVTEKEIKVNPETPRLLGMNAAALLIAHHMRSPVPGTRLSLPDKKTSLPSPQAAKQLFLSQLSTSKRRGASRLSAKEHTDRKGLILSSLALP